jgi:hypothetical protein
MGRASPAKSFTAPQQPLRFAEQRRRVAAAEQGLRAPGQALDAGTRRQLEPQFGMNFSRVRLHWDSRAADALDAHAYTVGSDIVLGHDAPPAGTRGWNQLLAHELTHVAQGSGTLEAPARLGKTASNDDEPREKEAQRASEAAAKLPERVGPKAITVGDQTFAATLDRRAALLSIERPVEFDFIDPSLEEQASELPLYRRWDGDGEKGAFKTKFMSEVFRAWSFKHLLVPDGDAQGETLPAVKVMVGATDKGSPEVPPIRLAVRALKKGAPAPNEGVRGSGGHLVDSSVNDTRSGYGRTHKTAAHEFGHTLGLDHPVCPGSDDRCYGVSESQKDSIMGWGMTVRPEDYAPFVTAMNALSPAKWKVQTGWWTRFGAWILLGSFAGMGATIGAIAGAAMGAPGVGLALGALIGHVVGGVAALIHQFS